MSKTYTAAELRADLHRVVDEVLASGKPRRVVREGRVPQIGPEPTRKRRLDLAKPPKLRGVFKGDFDQLVAASCEADWSPQR